MKCTADYKIDEPINNVYEKKILSKTFSHCTTHFLKNSTFFIEMNFIIQIL